MFPALGFSAVLKSGHEQRLFLCCVVRANPSPVKHDRAAHLRGQVADVLAMIVINIIWRVAIKKINPVLVLRATIRCRGGIYSTLLFRERDRERHCLHSET